MLFSGCSEDNPLTPGSDQNGSVESSLKGTKKPLPKLIGELDCDFSFENPPTFWNGTVDFGTYGLYNITFISYGAPRGYSQASPFEEDFIIYLGTDWTIPENVYMRGYNAGVVTYANKDPDPVKFLANGKVEEAYGPLEMWQGCNMHSRGVVTWIDIGIPEGCNGTFQIN